jgi:hypothetical protein
MTIFGLTTLICMQCGRNMPAKKNFTSCDWKFTQTLFSDSSTGYTIKILLTLIRVFYDYFRTDNPDLHAVSAQVFPTQLSQTVGCV